MASSESESHLSIHSPPKWSLHSSFLRRRIPQQFSIRCHILHQMSITLLTLITYPTTPPKSTHPSRRRPAVVSSLLLPHHPPLPQSQSRQCLLSILSLLRPASDLRSRTLGPDQVQGPATSSRFCSAGDLHFPGPGPDQVLVQPPHPGFTRPNSWMASDRSASSTGYLSPSLFQHYSPPAEMLVITLTHHPHLHHPATANHFAASLPLSPPSSSPTVPFPVQSSRYPGSWCPELLGLRPGPGPDQVQQPNQIWSKS